MADVLAVFIETAAQEVSQYAEKIRSRPEEAMRMVREAIGSQAFQREITGPECVYSPEVLLSFMQRVEAALYRGANSSRSTETRTETNQRVLRDLRDYVASECASLRREPKEQQIRQPANALLDLSRFLARCCEACWRHASGENASDISMNINRVGTLRGAGNAIIAQAAAEVLKAWQAVMR